MQVCHKTFSHNCRTECLLLKDVIQWDLHVAARVEEERQRICSHAENSTSNHTGKQKKTLHRGVGVSKVMSTHSERWDFLYLISTGHSCDSSALIWCHVSRILNSQKNISHSKGDRQDSPLGSRAACVVRRVRKGGKFGNVIVWGEPVRDKQKEASSTTESGRARQRQQWLTHQQQGSADTNWTHQSSAVP